ncbi:MAG: hypothetical protein IPK29_08905 [Betaproteobacteria bacterium]|jgi:hypothetical protein|nr:hypothetical protein [Betaproteobacteria bacterium]
MSGAHPPPSGPPPAAPGATTGNASMATRDVAARIYIELAAKMPSPDKAESLARLAFKLADVFAATEKKINVENAPKVASFDDNFFDELVDGKKS